MPPSTESVSTADDNPDRDPLAFKTAIPWVLIGLTPVLMALASWDPESTRTNLQDWIRFLGIPVFVVELVVIILATLAKFEPLKLLSKMPTTAAVALLALIAIDLGDAILVAPDPTRAAFRAYAFLLHILFGLAVAHLLTRQGTKAHWFLWRSVVIGLCGYLVTLIVFILVMPDPEHFDWHYFGLGVTNIRHAAFFPAVGAAAAVGLACAARTNRELALWTTAASLMFGMSFWSGTRGSILGVWVAFGVAVLMFRQLRGARALAVLVCSTATGLLISLAHSVQNQMFGINRLVSSTHLETFNSLSSGRLDLWAGTWRKILEKPFFGYGQDQLLKVVPESQHLFNHPHNSLLQLLMQWGLVGGICFVIVAAMTLTRCYRNLRGERMLHLPAFMVLATLLVMSLHDGTLFFTYPVVMVTLCVASMIVPLRSELPSTADQ